MGNIYKISENFGRIAIGVGEDVNDQNQRQRTDELLEENDRLQNNLLRIINNVWELVGQEAAPDIDPDESLQALEDYLGKLKAEISQSEWVENELRSEINHLRNHINNAKNFAVYQLVVDPANESFKVVFISPSFTEIFSPADPMDHNSWMEMLHPDELEKMEEAHRRAFRETHRFERVVKCYHPAKEDWVWLQFLATATPDGDGNPKWVDGIFFDVTEQKRIELKMLDYQRRLQTLAQKQFDDGEQERRRVAEVLHDDVGQDLALALFKLNQARERQAEIEPVLDDVAPLIEQAISYTRSLTKELCPPALCQMGLISGLEWLAERMMEHYQVQTGFQARGEFIDIDDQVGSLMFRTTAELLNNVAKHSRASTAEVFIEKIDGKVSLVVTDDGVGFSYSAEELHDSGGFGLFMISERLRSIGGDIEIDTAPDEGTNVRVEVPLPG